MIYQASIAIRQDVSKKMQQRAMYRRNRRGRKCHYRPARWANHASMRKNGRIAPSIKSKVGSHLRERDFVVKMANGYSQAVPCISNVTLLTVLPAN